VTSTAPGGGPPGAFTGVPGTPGAQPGAAASMATTNAALNRFGHGPVNVLRTQRVA
jgi:hypothetical protein